MKTTLLLIALVSLYSCQFNQSVNKDLTTGAFSRGDGIRINDVTIEVNGKVDNRNEFIYGESVNFVFNNVMGLKNSNGKTFPELSMTILKNNQDTVLFHANLLENLNTGTDISPLQLQANFIAALPNKNNETFKVIVIISDKIGEGKFRYELPFIVKESNLLDVKSKGIAYSDIYLWNESLKQPVLDNNISFENLFILILNDVEGLEVINNKVFPIFSIDLIDSDGSIILSDQNLLSAYEKIGVDPEDLKNQVTANLSFTKGSISNPCTLTAKLKDKNSTKEINIFTELNIN